MKSFGMSSSLKEEAVKTKMQGIVSILGTDSDSERVKIFSNSLRRTLSADMSSRKWLSQHGFSPLKKIASSQQFPVSITEYSSSSSSSSSDNEDDDYDHDHCNNNSNKSQFETENQSQFDIWSSIIQQKNQAEEDSNLPAPYVHPLVRRSTSSLSEKSLQICTESLGSETGSDGFSAYTPSETSDTEEEKEEHQQQQEQPEVVNINNYDVEELKYNNLVVASKEPAPKSFPPPISSISSHRNGTSVLMKSHRDNGRLVLEAVSVSSQNNFRAERQDGRLVLTFINGHKEEEHVVVKKQNEVDQFEVELEGTEDEKEHEDEDNEKEKEEEDEDEEEVGEHRGTGCIGDGSGKMKFAMEQAPKLSGGIINVHRLATMVDKTIMIANKNPTTWTNQAKFEEGLVGMVDEVVKPNVAMTQSLPPRPPMARMIPSAPKMVASAKTAKLGAVSFNPYEYYWKPKPLSPATVSKTLNLNTKNTMLIAKNNRNNLNKMLYTVQNCKEQKRSVLFQQSYCIATS